MFLSVFGHLNIDLIINVPSIPQEGSIFTNRTEMRPGGTARNIALVAGKLGVETEIFSKVGLQFPENYINELKNNNVNTDNIVIDKKFGFSPICVIVSDIKKQVAFIDQGPMGDNGIEYPKKPKGKWIHFGTGDPNEYLKIKESSKGNISFDPGQEIHYRYDKNIFKDMVKNTNILFFNRIEFEKAKELMDLNEMIKNTENIIVTLGENGCILINKNEKVSLPAYKVNAKETVGAGDAFRAGFYFGLKNNYDIKRACLFGMKIASIVVENGKIPDNFEITGTL